MTWNRTLTEIVTAVRTRSDTLGRASRHPDSLIQVFVNESYRSLVNRATSAGSSAFCRLVTLDDTTRLAGDTGGVTLRLQGGSGAYSESLQPPILSLRVYQESRWQTLPRVELSEALDIIDETRSGTLALAWAIQEGGLSVFGEASPSSQGTQAPLLLLTPSLPAGAVVKVLCPSYVPSVDDIAATYVYQLNEYGYEWLVYDCCIKLASRDAEMGAQGQLWMAERDRAWSDLVRQINSAKSTPAQRPRIKVPATRRYTGWNRP